MDSSIVNLCTDFADPSSLPNQWFDSSKGMLSGNRAFYSNPQVDKWLRKAATVSDQSERIALYTKVQEQVTKDAAYVYLYQKNYQVGMRKDIKGFVFNPMLERVFKIGRASCRERVCQYV